jgi:hypothetical protein
MMMIDDPEEEAFRDLARKLEVKPKSLIDYMRPVGWTKDTNLTGYLSGTYDVLAVWRRGPEKEPLSNIGIYTTAQVEEILKKCGVCHDLLEKNLGPQKVKS